MKRISEAIIAAIFSSCIALLFDWISGWEFSVAEYSILYFVIFTSWSKRN